MGETTEVVLAKLAIQIENLTREISALRAELAEQRETHASEMSEIWAKMDANRKTSDSTQNSLTDMRGMLRGGASVLAFFQMIVFSVFVWLFSQVSAQGTAITELKGYDQQLILQLRQANVNANSAERE